MISARNVASVLVALGSAGCVENPVPDTDVFTVAVCPTGHVCDKLASGHSSVTMEVCIGDGVKDPKADLKASLTTTAGSWLIPDSSDERTADLTWGDAACLYPVVQTPDDRDHLRVDVVLAGVTQSVEFDLDAVSVAALDLVTDSILLDDSGAVHATAHVWSVDDLPLSAGTKVFFTVTPTPSTAVAYATSPHAIVANGVATVDIRYDAAVTELDLSAQAELPAWASDAAEAGPAGEAPTLHR